MRERNPFLIRSAERISNDDEFIKLFSPKIIEIIKDNIDGYSLWNQFFRFQSSPGGGKTSLLKLFNPSVLNRLLKIYKSRVDSNPDIDNLFKSLKQLDAFNENEELNVLTVYISCASDYATIFNLSLEQPKKIRLFISLLNSRILISFVRSLIDYLKVYKSNLDLKTELRKIKIIPNQLTNVPGDFPIDCNALDLYEWSGNLEKIIYREIDGLKNKDTLTNEHVGLFSAQILSSSQVIYENNEETVLPKNFAIFFDDVQKLSLEQYNFLTNEIIEKRPSSGIWFAERLDLFSLEELWSKDASTGGRDYVKEINLEEILKGKGGKGKFKEFTISVAEKRVERSKDVTLNSFPVTLSNDVDIDDMKIEESISILFEKFNQITHSKHTYDTLLKYLNNKKFNSRYEKLMELRTAQILIERKEKKEAKEPSLFQNEYLVDEFKLDKKNFSFNNIQYLLSRDFDFPFYYGYDNLVGLSSSNIEQFLAFSGRLFENIISSKILGKDSTISSKDQQKILLAEANRRWKDINSLSNSNEVKSLLASIAKFCSSQDNLSGFPYRGVTGIAISLEDRKRLTNSKLWPNNPHYELITKTLMVAIANNLIEISVDKKQGKKGEEPKTLFFLNRWVCLKYKLSFGYSGWRKVSLDTLGKWIKRGYKGKDIDDLDNINKNLYG